jgi:tripartite-type tricarboxylate transporter receptor subunit TctC
MVTQLKRLIISADAGSVFDKVGRAVGEGLQRTIGREILLENVGDSAGVGGAEAGARAAPDAGTVLICNKGAITSHPHTANTYQSTDFDMLCQVAEAPIVVAVARNSSFKTLRELIEAARQEPETISYSTPNPYHTQRLAMEDFGERHGLKFKFSVLPGGNAATLRQLNEGKAHFAFLAAHNLVAPEKAGEIRVLGVAHNNRLRFAPRGVEARQLIELRETGRRTMDDPQTIGAIEKLFLVPSFLNHTVFVKKVASDTAFHLNVLRHLDVV